MLQRIQSLHLLVVAALSGVMFFLPLMWFANEGEQVYMTALHLLVGDAVIGKTPIYLPILMGAATLLPLLTIFLFKRRMLQVRLCAVEAVLLFGVLAMEAMLYFGPQNSLDAGALQPASFAPVAALLFVWLAARAILRDELLVRSLDRIR